MWEQELLQSFASEVAPTSGELPQSGGTPLGSAKAEDAVQEEERQGHDAHPY